MGISSCSQVNTESWLALQSGPALASSQYDSQARQSWELWADEGFRRLYCSVSHLHLLPVFLQKFKLCCGSDANSGFFFLPLQFFFDFANFAFKDSLASFWICVAEAEQPARLLMHQNLNQKEKKLKLDARAQLC